MADTPIQVTFNGGQDNAKLTATMVSVDPAAITALQAVEVTVNGLKQEVLVARSDTVAAKNAAQAADSSAGIHEQYAQAHRDATLQIKKDMDALILAKSQEFDTEVMAATRAKADAQTAANSVSDSANIAQNHANMINGYLSQARDLLTESVQESYANRAMINTMISTFMIELEKKGIE